MSQEMYTRSLLSARGDELHYVSAMKTLLLLLAITTSLHAQVPQAGLKMWLRADSLVTQNAQGQLASWKNIVDGRAALVPAGSSAVTTAPLNGRASMVLDGAGYIEAPSLMPVGKDYTVVVVLQVNNIGATNNIVSGNDRAFWLGGTAFPRMLHAGNFSQQAVSAVGVNGASIVRVRFDNESGIARLAVNNAQGAADPIPQNIDSVIFLGAYQRGNFFSGQIAEVLVYDREVEGADLLALDTYLHTRYAIPRVPDPLPPTLVFDAVPQNMMLARCGDSLFVAGRVAAARVKNVAVTIDTNGVDVVSQSFFDVAVNTTFRVGFVVESGAHLYNVVVTADTGGVELDTVINNRNITCGEVIAITGQSNSIFGAAGIAPSPFSRTYGGNFSSQRADTLYKASSAAGNGGGANVGGWGLYMQNAIMEKMGTPTMVINGGVGGTSIQQHLPDPNNRLNLSTIYGSWLYRVQQSGSKDRIRWLFWYQGESNSGADDYTALFDQLRNAWLEDLPNLQHIVVVQIRPGCGGSGHHKLRDSQRKLEERHPEVVVHAAAGLPFHDGCHYSADGYFTLGEQLFNLYRITELSLMPGKYASSPTIATANCIDAQCTRVRLTFNRAAQLRMTPDMSIGGSMRTARDAFFANDDPTLQPTAVTVTIDAVELTFASPISRISYVPDKFYVGTEVIYEGPWLVNADGVGAITFHNVEVGGTSVAYDGTEDGTFAEDGTKDGTWDGTEDGTWDGTGSAYMVDMRGLIVATNGQQARQLPSGVYMRHARGRTVKVVLVR